MWTKYGKAGQATCDNVTARMRFACCIAKATDGYRRLQTHTQNK